MANELVPYQMANALKEIDRLSTLIKYRCTREDIREIKILLEKDLADFAGRGDCLDLRF